jgi:hypothetical protein
LSASSVYRKTGRLMSYKNILIIAPLVKFGENWWRYCRFHLDSVQLLAAPSGLPYSNKNIVSIELFCLLKWLSMCDVHRKWIEENLSVHKKKLKVLYMHSKLVIYSNHPYKYNKLDLSLIPSLKSQNQHQTSLAHYSTVLLLR